MMTNNGSPRLRLKKAEDVNRRNQLSLSKLSPWNRSNSDPTLDNFVRSSSRRRDFPQCQFLTSIEPFGGDLEFRPEYREAFVAYPRDACASSPRHARRRFSTVEGTSLQGTSKEEDLQRTRRRYQSAEGFHESSLVSAPADYETEFRAQFTGTIPSLEDRVHQLRRQLTSLHLEGEQTFFPEYKEQYVEYLNIPSCKQELLVPPLNLHSEGDRIFETEYLTKFLKYSPSKRRELIRYHTQLEILKGHMNTCPEYRASFIDFPRQRPVSTRPRASIELENNASMETLTEQREQFSSTPLSPRPSIEGRPTSLRLNGDVERPRTVSTSSVPEYRDAFRDFPRSRPAFPKPAGSLTPEGPWHGKNPEYRAEYVDFPRQRPETKKQIASLKPFGGVSDKCHEYRESYKDFPRKRPQVKKPHENLKPEGELATSPEYREKYQDFPRQRPTVKKTPEQFKPEGKLMVSNPEYKEEYKDFPRKRPDVKKPVVNLKTEGDFTNLYAEYKENFKDSPRVRPKVLKPSGNLKPEGEMMEKAAEYKNSYVEFPSKRPDIRKPTENLKPASDPMDQSPEYKHSYQDFPRERPKVPKPVQNLKPEGELNDHNEYRDNYVDFPRHRPEVPRPECQLKSEGPWLGRYPEYRAAFIDLPRHRPIVPKPSNVLSEPDTLGGGYTPTFNGTPRSANMPPEEMSPRSHSPAGMPTGAPTHVKRSSSRRARYLGRPGHLSDAVPLSRRSSSSSARTPEDPYLQEPAREQERLDPYKDYLQAPYDLEKRPLSRMVTSARERASATSAFQVLEPPSRIHGHRCRGPPGMIGKFGTGWLQRCPNTN